MNKEDGRETAHLTHTKWLLTLWTWLLVLIQKKSEETRREKKRRKTISDCIIWQESNLHAISMIGGDTMYNIKRQLIFYTTTSVRNSLNILSNLYTKYQALETTAVTECKSSRCFLVNLLCSKSPLQNFIVPHEQTGFKYYAHSKIKATENYVDTQKLIS